MAAVAPDESVGTAEERIGRWNEALLETLLPLQDEPGTGVVLASDREALRLAALRAGFPPKSALQQFGSDVALAFGIGRIAGFQSLRRAASAFAAAQPPRPVPPFLSVLCLCVLAASLMGPDKDRPTHAYYAHLRWLLGLCGTGAPPDIEALPPAFALLADWLKDDQAGRRGLLVLPDDPHPPFVGLFVSQTVFRRRDREILSEFFAARMLNDGIDFDPLPRLRRWPGRHQLTRHARELIKDNRFADQVRAAVRSARAAWDGSIPDDKRGGRCWPVTLHLYPYPPRLCASARNREPVEFELAGTRMRLDPCGAVELPWQELERITAGGLLGNPASAAGALRLPRLVESVIFELGEDGLEQVERPVGEKVWLLSRNPAHAHRFVERVFPTGDLLPEPWRLYRDVETDELDVERAAAHPAQRPFALVGGLPLERHVYLSGGGPLLETGELDELDTALPVYANGTRIGGIGSGERLALPGDPGSYEIAIGPLDKPEWHARYYVEAAGQPSGVGSLAYPLDGPRALRGGAARAETIVGDRVCGATTTIRYTGALPFLTRARRLYSITADGTLHAHEQPPRPVWFDLVGIESGRWELDRDDAVWVFCPPGIPGRGGWAKRLQARPVALERAAAEEVHRLGPKAQTNAREAWLELCRQAERLLAEVAS